MATAGCIGAAVRLLSVDQMNAVMAAKVTGASRRSSTISVWRRRFWVGLIYLAYLLCNLAVFRARLGGWPWRQAPFSLGRWGMLVGNPRIRQDLIPIARFGQVDEVESVVVMLACNGYITVHATVRRGLILSHRLFTYCFLR
jgi:hypothetical protein